MEGAGGSWKGSRKGLTGSGDVMGGGEVEAVKLMLPYRVGECCSLIHVERCQSVEESGGWVLIMRGYVHDEASAASETTNHSVVCCLSVRRAGSPPHLPLHLLCPLLGCMCCSSCCHFSFDTHWEHEYTHHAVAGVVAALNGTRERCMVDEVSGRFGQRSGPYRTILVYVYERLYRKGIDCSLKGWETHLKLPLIVNPLASYPQHAVHAAYIHPTLVHADSIHRFLLPPTVTAGTSRHVPSQRPPPPPRPRYALLSIYTYISSISPSYHS